jgi:peroxiredoxin Q/BCP
MSILSRLFSRDSTDSLAEGAPIPSVTQINQDEQAIDLAQIGSDGYLLVYFYPKADTPGCTKQACSLRDAYAALIDHDVTILGVSNDKPNAQLAFQQKFELPFDLLADTNHAVIDAFGVPKTMGFASRQAFLFKDGTLIWKDLSASTTEQAADILNVIGSHTLDK